MASAVAPRSSKLPKKNRAVFERLQPASPAFNLRVPTRLAHGEDDESSDDIRASYSTPHFTFTCEDIGGRDSPTVRPQLLSPNYKISANSSPRSLGTHSPLFAATLAPPGSPFLQAGASSSQLLESSPSAVSLLGDSDDLQAGPSSAALGKDWRSMQVRV